MVRSGGDIEWLVNFHLKHKDHVKVKVKTTNAALNSITSETDGFVVDLTPAILLNLGDGTALNQDQIFQVSFLVLQTIVTYYDILWNGVQTI
jgi:hypothetical protein